MSDKHKIQIREIGKLVYFAENSSFTSLIYT